MKLEVLQAFSHEVEKTSSSLLAALLSKPMGDYALKRDTSKAGKERAQKLRDAIAKVDRTPVTEAKSRQGPHFDVSKERVVVRKNEAPEILAHELGHAEIHRSPMGRLVQNPTANLVSGLSPLAGIIAGASAGSKGPSMGTALALAIATAPQALYEAEASRRGMRKMREAGASEEELSRARKKLMSAWGTYAIRAPEAVGNYLLTQRVVGGY
jgi:Zn-dependent membrane protease YugP